MITLLVLAYLITSIVYLYYSFDEFIEEAILDGNPVTVVDYVVMFLICLLWPALIAIDFIGNRR